MRLADDDKHTIAFAPGAIVLRPSLRAAFRLERKYNGFHNLFNAVVSANLTAISDVIKEGTGTTTALTNYLDQADGEPLMVRLDLLLDPITNFLLALAGSEGAKTVAIGEPMPFVDYHTKLFGIATGWLGWSPEEAWNATPAEILEAQKAHREKLVVIHGGKHDEEQTIELQDGKLDPSVRAELNALGDLSVVSMSEVP
jgi:hypothetical protein